MRKGMLLLLNLTVPSLLTRLLNTQSAYCCFPAAAETYSLALQLLGLPEDATDESQGGPYAMAETCDKAVQTDDELYDNR